MKIIRLQETAGFTRDKMVSHFLVEKSEFFKLINFNLDAGVIFPVHAHDLDGDLSIQVLEGRGWFLGDRESRTAAEPGDILISAIREPHGVEAETQMRILVTIAPPI